MRLYDSTGPGANATGMASMPAWCYIPRMPEVARFYGITIKLFFGDHPPPHFHATYGENGALFDIKTLKILEGSLPVRARHLVLEWAKLHQAELEAMWNSQEFRKLPPLE